MQRTVLLMLSALLCLPSPGPLWAEPLILPSPGSMVSLSPSYQPPVLKGIKVYPQEPFRFDFILDAGDRAGQDLRQASQTLMKYFLASLTIPAQDLWVNLSPYEKDRIIPDGFGQTEMGRDLLAQDYLLKQISASLLHPDQTIGSTYWKRLYEEAVRKLGSTRIPVESISKVWVVPENAVVYENKFNTAGMIVQSRLKVLLEQDLVALSRKGMPETSSSNALSQQVMREVILPQLEKEVNESHNFARLRQIFSSLILATWYKRKLKESLLTKVYADQNKVKGVDIKNPEEVPAIYQRYLAALKKGVYHMVKDELDPVRRQVVPRKYFSGGFHLDLAMLSTTRDAAMVYIPQAGYHRIEISVLDVPSKHWAHNISAEEIERLAMIFRGFSKEQRKFLRSGLIKADFDMRPIFSDLVRYLQEDHSDNLVRYIKDVNIYQFFLAEMAEGNEVVADALFRQLLWNLSSYRYVYLKQHNNVPDGKTRKQFELELFKAFQDAFREEIQQAVGQYKLEHPEQPIPVRRSRPAAMEMEGLKEAPESPVKPVAKLQPPSVVLPPAARIKRKVDLKEEKLKKLLNRRDGLRTMALKTGSMLNLLQKLARDTELSIERVQDLVADFLRADKRRMSLGDFFLDLVNSTNQQIVSASTVENSDRKMPEFYLWLKSEYLDKHWERHKEEMLQTLRHWFAPANVEAIFNKSNYMYIWVPGIYRFRVDVNNSLKFSVYVKYYDKENKVVVIAFDHPDYFHLHQVALNHDFGEDLLAFNKQFPTFTEFETQYRAESVPLDAAMAGELVDPFGGENEITAGKNRLSRSQPLLNKWDSLQERAARLGVTAGLFLPMRPPENRISRLEEDVLSYTAYQIRSALLYSRRVKDPIFSPNPLGPYRLRGLCGDSSSDVHRRISYWAKELGVNVQLVAHVANELLKPIVDDPSRNHAFDVVTFSSGKSYLVDLTYLQFWMKRYSSYGSPGFPGWLVSFMGGVRSLYPLLVNGFIPLTEETGALYAASLKGTQLSTTSPDWDYETATRPEDPQFADLVMGNVDAQPDFDLVDYFVALANLDVSESLLGEIARSRDAAMAKTSPSQRQRAMRLLKAQVDQVDQFQSNVGNFIQQLTAAGSDRSADLKEIVADLRTFYALLPEYIAGGQSTADYQMQLETSRRQRDQLYAQIAKTDQLSNAKSLARLNQEAILLNRRVLKLQVLLAIRMLLPTPRKGAAIASLHGAENSVLKLRRELMFQMERLESLERIKRIEANQPGDWLGNLVHEYRLGSFTLTIKEQKPSSEVIVMERRTISIGRRMSDLMKAVRQGKPELAIAVVDELMKVHQMTYVQAVRPELTLIFDLRELRDYLDLWKDGTISAEDAKQKLSQRLDIGKQGQWINHLTSSPVRYTHIAAAFKGYLDRLKQYVSEIAVLSRHKAVLSYFISVLDDAGSRSVSKRDRDLMTAALIRIQERLRRDVGDEKIRSQVKLESVLGLLKSDDFDQQRPAVRRMLEEIVRRFGQRLDNIDRIVRFSKNDAERYYAEYRDDELKSAADELLLLSEQGKISELSSHIQDLQERYFQRTLTEPGYVRISRTLKNTMEELAKPTPPMAVIKKLLQSIKDDVLHKNDYRIGLEVNKIQAVQYVSPGTQVQDVLKAHKLQAERTKILLNNRWVPVNDFVGMRLKDLSKLTLSDSAMTQPDKTGGIDFNTDHWQVQSTFSGVQTFQFDAAAVARYAQSLGFVPYILGIEPLKDLTGFLDG